MRARFDVRSGTTRLTTLAVQDWLIMPAERPHEPGLLSV
jgi:hypothetical protein